MFGKKCNVMQITFSVNEENMLISQSNLASAEMLILGVSVKCRSTHNDYCIIKHSGYVLTFTV